MIKQITVIITLTCVYSIANAQTLPVIKKLFYNLPLDTPRSKLSGKIKTDARFLETWRRPQPDSGYLFVWGGYVGQIKHPEFFSSVKPDSGSIEITWGTTYQPKTRGTKKYSASMSIYRLTYYYPTSPVTEAEYDSVIKKLTSALGADDGETSWEDDSTGTGNHGVSFKLNKKKPLPELHVTRGNYKIKNFKLEIEYSRRED